MIKKISVQDLRIGMFIHDLNAGWMDHVFFRSRFMLRKEEDLQKIQTSGIRELYIDTVKGMVKKLRQVKNSPEKSSLGKKLSTMEALREFRANARLAARRTALPR